MHTYTAGWDELCHLCFNIYQSLSPGSHFQWHQESLLLSPVPPQQRISVRMVTYLELLKSENIHAAHSKHQYSTITGARVSSGQRMHCAQ